MQNSYLPYDIDAVFEGATGAIEVPDGKYQGIVYAVQRHETAYGMDVLIVYEITEGPYAGQQIKDRYHFGDNKEYAANAASRLKTTAARLGADISAKDGFGPTLAALECLVDAPMDIEKQTKPNPKKPDYPYVNIYGRPRKPAAADQVPF